MKNKNEHPDLFGAHTQPDQSPETPPKCGKKAFGFMPPCVLPQGHAGDCEDGFGGHYSHSEPQTPATQKPLPVIRDWHDPRNEACAQNQDVDADCTCKRARNRKNYTVRTLHLPEAPLHGVKQDIIMELHPNGLIVLRERGRRTRYETTVGRIFAGCVWSAAMSAKREKAAAKKARKGARQP